ncbi:MAG: hypothetical protein AB7S38_26020 [Vulcanimicrobiota bacterium]
MSPDSRTIAAWADSLISKGWNYPAFLREATSTAPPALYLGVITLFGLLKTTLPDHWAPFLVGLNVLAFGLVTGLACRLVWSLTGSSRATLFSFCLFLGGFDIFQWCRYVLSDPTFLALATVCLWLASLVVLEGGTRARLVQLGAVILIAFFYRPTGFLLLPTALFAVLFQRRDKFPPHFRPALVVTLSLLSACFLIVLNAHWMRDVSSRPISLRSQLEHQAAHYNLGEVVWDRPELAHPPPASKLDVVKITLDRWLWFWAPVYRGFSLSHNLINLFLFLPCYAGVLCLLVRLWAGSRLGQRQTLVIWMLLAFIFTVSCWHAIIQVDYDWRYRLPTLPALLVLAGCGFHEVFPEPPSEEDNEDSHGVAEGLEV